MVVLIILLIIILTALILAGSFFVNLALNMQNDKNMAKMMGSYTPSEITDEYKAYLEIREKEKTWLEDNGKEVFITNNEDMKLHAYIVENEVKSDKWVYLFHGYGNNLIDSINPGLEFYKNVYNLLLPDARAFGKSEGKYTGMGYLERKDALLWIDEIIKINSNAEIVLYGISMGGASVMMTVGEKLPENVKVAVEDCGYSSAWDEFSFQLKSMFKLPSFPVLHFSSLMSKIKAGYFLKEASSVKQVEKAEIPILFIHGDADTFVPTEMVYKVYEAAKTEKDLIIAPGAGHGTARQFLGESYWESVFSFVNRYI